MKVPPAIPDHTLLRPIGRGAYGEVWLARNVMGALRAVKIVERRQFDSDRPYEREFAGIQRYEPVSRLAEGLVHVLHVGRNDSAGYFYYVMELADPALPLTSAPHHRGMANEPRGESSLAVPDALMDDYTPRTLRSDLKSFERLAVEDCLRVAIDLVGGLARLHEHGLVHRDVKPGNIIFVNGHAKLADIGLVSTHSEGRTFVGTEGYIPPEGPGSPAADLYALGMSLYEAITGLAPDEFPKVPPEWFAEEAGTEAIEFHEIVLKACEGDKLRRYRNAEEMRADLALLHSGQSVRRMRTLERRAARTQRFTGAAVFIVMTAVAMALIANWRARVAEKMRLRESALLHEARDARESESDARVRAENAEHDARRQLNTALLEQARALVLSRELGHRTRTLEALRRASGAMNPAELRRVAFAALVLPDLRLEHEINVGPGTTLMQPDRRFERIALCRGRGPVTICSLPGLEVLATLPASTNLYAYVGLWSADGRFLAVKRQHDDGGARCDWEVWDVGQSQRVLVTGPDAAHNAAMFHPAKPWFLVGYGRGRVVEWDVEHGRELRTFRVPNTVHAIAYSPGGNQIAASYRIGNTNWVIAFHDANHPELFHAIDYPESIEFATWHPQGRWVSVNGGVASEWGRGVHLIDPGSGSVTTIGQHRIKTAMSEFTGEGDYLLSGGWDREIICWDLRNSQRAFSYAGTAYRHSLSADGKRCAVELPDHVMQFYAFERPISRKLSGNAGNALWGGRFSPDGRWLVARDDRHLCVWDLSGNGPAALVPVPRKTTSAFFSPDSHEFFVVPDEYSQRGYFGHWQLAAGTNADATPRVEPLRVQFPRGVTRAALVGDEIVMTSAEGVRFVALTNIASGDGRVVRVRPGLGYVSPDGRWLAMLYDYSPEVGVYRLPSMEQVARLQTSNYVGSITFSPQADEMLVINRSGAEWFDTTTWQRTRRRPGAPVAGSYAFYTPDGNGIWMVTHFRDAALLDRRTLEPLLPFPRDVLPLAVSPDGQQLAVSVAGRQVELWDMKALHSEMAKLGLDW